MKVEVYYTTKGTLGGEMFSDMDVLDGCMDVLK